MAQYDGGSDTGDNNSPTNKTLHMQSVFNSGFKQHNNANNAA